MATDITPDKNAEAESIGEINKYDFRTETEAVFKSQKGLNEEIVRQISAMKEEPEWMLEFRLKALEIFESKPMPEWGGDIDINFQDFTTILSRRTGRKRAGTMFRKKSRKHLIVWGFPKQKGNSWQALRLSLRVKWSMEVSLKT